MQNRLDLRKELGSLDLLIDALSCELVNQPQSNMLGDASDLLLKEMEEALCRLRQERGLCKVLLTALDDSCAVVMSDNEAGLMHKSKCRIGHSQVC